MSKSEYFSELGKLSAKMRTRSKLLKEYYRAMAEIRWHPERRAEFYDKMREAKRLLSVLDADIEEERSRISRKTIYPPLGYNKLLAMHKRWFYPSKRGTGHDISIEAIASMVVGAEESKEQYKELLMDFLETEMRKEHGFERLTELEERVEGFEEKLTREQPRPPRLETLEWWHKVFTSKQLDLDEFMRLERVITHGEHVSSRVRA